MQIDQAATGMEDLYGTIAHIQTYIMSVATHITKTFLKLIDYQITYSLSKNTVNISYSYRHPLAYQYRVDYIQPQ